MSNNIYRVYLGKFNDHFREGEKKIQNQEFLRKFREKKTEKNMRQLLCIALIGIVCTYNIASLFLYHIISYHIIL